jgi:hypothetical protein
MRRPELGITSLDRYYRGSVMDRFTDRGSGPVRTEPKEDLTPDLLRFAAALVTLMAAIALGLVR